MDAHNAKNHPMYYVDGFRFGVPGCWLVFDFSGSDFRSALLRVDGTGASVGFVDFAVIVGSVDAVVFVIRRRWFDDAEGACFTERFSTFDQKWTLHVELLPFLLHDLSSFSMIYMGDGACRCHPFR